MTAMKTSMRPDAARRRTEGPGGLLWSLAALICAGLALSPAPAAAQTVVLGKSLAAACYQHARVGDASPDAMDACDRGLKQATSRRNIAATYLNRSILWIHRGQYAKALEDVEASVHYKAFAEADSTRGAIYFHMGRYSEAVEEITRAIESGELMEPEKAYYNRGLTYEKMERIEAAYYDYEMAAELAPEWDRPREELSRFIVTDPAPESS